MENSYFPAYLPLIQRIINLQVNSRTRVSPTQTIFGNAINHDSHFLSEPLQNDSDNNPGHHEAIAPYGS